MFFKIRKTNLYYRQWKLIPHSNDNSLFTQIETWNKTTVVLTKGNAFISYVPNDNRKKNRNKTTLKDVLFVTVIV